MDQRGGMDQSNVGCDGSRIHRKRVSLDVSELTPSISFLGRPEEQREESLSGGQSSIDRPM